MACIGRHVFGRIARPLIHVAAPLALGVLLYLFARPRGIVVFEWLEAMGLGATVQEGRDRLAPIARTLPAWVRFSLPDGLWAYAFARAVSLTWNDQRSVHSLPWLLLVVASTLGAELGQALGLVPGTFDGVDLAMCSGGVGLGLVPTPLRKFPP
jgi:hypothetical protein